MHPKTREVRRPDSGIDPRGTGAQPPLLQGYLKHRKPAAKPAGGQSALPATKSRKRSPKDSDAAR
jgi:hypothetical protein